jgi:hypothetical protein
VARLIGWLVFVAIIVAAYLFARDYVRRHPQQVPWTRLELAHPIGAFTGRKLADLTDEPAQCRALFDRAGVEIEPAPPRRDSADCGYSDGVRLGAAEEVAYRPRPPVTSCPVAAAMHLLRTRVLQPAAERHFGTRVAAIHHAGSYSCRRLYGRDEGDFSEHATADALDIAGFTLADGRRVSVLEDWNGRSAEAAFLREVRDGACRLFATVLSPEYNEAHADHLHLDQAERGAMGFRVCS